MQAMGLKPGYKTPQTKGCTGTEETSSSNRMRIEDQWEKSPGTLLKYSNLNNLVIKRQVVELDQNGAFYVITHPAYVEKAKIGSNSLGWKLHISIDSNQLEEGYDAIVAIISRYCFHFKVTNPVYVEGDRLIHGAQITLYLEYKEEPTIVPNDLEKMIREVDQALDEKGIAPGQLPDSDASTFSPYCTLRSDKSKLILLRQTFDYVPSWNTGRNFNPCNHPNPFATLLRDPVDTFDPASHLLTFFEFTDEGVKVKDSHFYYMLSSLVREYTLFDAMDEEAQEQFVFESCLTRANNINAQFLKEPFREIDAVLLVVKYAFYLVLVYEADPCRTKTSFHYYVDQWKFSRQCTHSDSFMAALKWLEEYSSQRTKINLSNKNEVRSLDEMLQTACKRRMRGLPHDRLIELINTGHLYTRQAALTELTGRDQKREDTKLVI